MDKISDLLIVIGICIRFLLGLKGKNGQNFEIPAIVAHVRICSKCSNHYMVTLEYIPKHLHLDRLDYVSKIEQISVICKGG